MDRISCLFTDYYPIAKLEQQERKRRWAPPLIGNKGVFKEEVLVEILARLGVRYVVRMRCVCKSWYALIDDVYFINRHYQIQCSRCKADGDVPIICSGLPYPRLPLLSKNNNDIPLDLTDDLAHDTAASFSNLTNLLELWDRIPGTPFNDWHMVGVVNGLVCIIWDTLNVGLWNPSTREFKAIPPWVNRTDGFYNVDLIGFGYDSISNDFKIVRAIWECIGKLIGHELYSTATNSWKRLKGVPPSACSKGLHLSMEGYLNGVCYWSYFPSHSDLTATPTRKILSFNFNTEVFESFTPPQNAIESKNGDERYWSITMYKESLAIAVTHTVLEKENFDIKVWVVTEFYGNSGIPKSWQHVLTMGPFRFIMDPAVGAFRHGGDVIFSRTVFTEDDDTFESSLYNLSTGTYKKLGLWISWSFHYVESLFPLSNTPF